MSLTFQEGSLFAERYRVVRSIANGAMGAIYEVIHVETDRRRALKVMLPHLAESPEFCDRFKLEARIAGRVESEFIVEVFDAGIDETTGMPFLVMELLRGEELGKRLRRAGRFLPEEVVGYLHQTALALDKTHRASIVHRDLKPGNLFLTERDDGSPRIKVLDFGVAKLVADVTSGAAATTATVGTPLYMAPEQFRGSAVTGAADIFALGMISYTLLVGRAYWVEEMREGGHVLAFAMKAVEGPKEAATARAARAGVTLPAGFDGWFAKVTALDPKSRFATATAATCALAEVFELPAPPLPPPPVSPSDAARVSFSPTSEREFPSFGSASLASVAPPRRRILALMLIGASLVVSGAAALWLAWGGWRERHLSDDPGHVEGAAAPPPAASFPAPAAPAITPVDGAALDPSGATAGSARVSPPAAALSGSGGRPPPSTPERRPTKAPPQRSLYSPD